MNAMSNINHHMHSVPDRQEVQMSKYMYYVIVCAWCKRTLELRGTDEEAMHEKVSHGVCESCMESMIND